MKAKRLIKSKFCRFLFSFDPCGELRLNNYRQKIKLNGEILSYDDTTQFSVLILNLMRFRVLVLSFMMQKSPPLLKNGVFRYPAPFSNEQTVGMVRVFRTWNASSDEKLICPGEKHDFGACSIKMYTIDPGKNIELKFGKTIRSNYVSTSGNI